MMKTENKNFIYSIIYQLLSFIIPIIITPYLSRVLGVNNIGIYSYSYSIVYYFMLGTLLGINNYGTRSISKSIDNKEKRSQVFFSIYYLQLISGFIMFLIYNLVINLCFKSDNFEIFLIQNIFLISAILDINWLYFGIEQFKITISRNIIIKILSVILVFIFVKNINDLWKYTLIISSSTLISQLYLWFRLPKFITKCSVKLNQIFNHFKDCLILFIPVISYSVYRIMDKTMLGAISGTEFLGLYENAEKIINIPISIITALGTIMLPHMSKIKNNDYFNKKLYESFELSFFLMFPMTIGLLIISNDFSIIFFGPDFEKCGIIIKLLAITIIFQAFSNVIRSNYLIPKKMDNIYVFSTILGAVINLIANCLLIPRYNYYGACIGTILAEFVVLLYQLINLKSQLNCIKIFNLFIKYLIKSIIIGIVIFIIGVYINNLVKKIIIQIIVAIIIYIIINYKYIIYDFLGKYDKE